MKIIPVDKLHRVELGVRAIRRTYNLLTPSPNALIEAAKIYRTGHRDYIDALHYTTAKTEDIPLLTIDHTFIGFLEQHGYRVEYSIYTPDNIKELLK